jgi:hypothetical protein
MDLEAPEPLEAEGMLCLLVSRPGRDPVEGAIGRAASGSPRALVAWGLSSCAQALASVIS